MPFRSGYLAKHRHRGRARRHASGTIARAWRKRKQRKTSLLARTALANRRNLKTMKRTIETKMIELPTATVGNFWAGQNLVRINVDINGQDTTPIPVVLKPFRELAQGDQASMRTGDWVKLKSLTYKIYFDSVAGLIPETNRVGCYVVLDRDPGNAVLPNLNGTVPGTLDAGSLLGGNSQLPHLRFQNMNTCGNTLRYKVLAHHMTNVQSTIAGSTYPPNRFISKTVKNPYRIKYNPATAVGYAADAPQNQELLLFFYSDSAAAPHPSVSVHCRYRFTDQG